MDPEKVFNNIYELANFKNILNIDNLSLLNIRIIENHLMLLYSGSLVWRHADVSPAALAKIFDEASLVFKSRYKEDILLGFDYRYYDNIIYISISIGEYKENLTNVYNILQDFSYFICIPMTYKPEVDALQKYKFLYNENSLVYNSLNAGFGILNIQDTEKISRVISLRYDCCSLELTFIIIFNILYKQNFLDFFSTDVYKQHYLTKIYYESIPLFESIESENLEEVKKLYNIAVSCFRYSNRNGYKEPLVVYEGKTQKKTKLNLNRLFIQYCDVTKDSFILSCKGALNSKVKNNIAISRAFENSLKSVGKELNISNIEGGLFIEKDILVNMAIVITNHNITFDLIFRILTLLYDIMGLDFNAEFTTLTFKNKSFKDFNIDWLRGGYVKIDETYNFYIMFTFVGDSERQCVLQIQDYYYTSTLDIINNKEALLYNFFFDLFINIYYYMSTRKIIWLFGEIMPGEFLTSEEYPPELKNKISKEWGLRLWEIARCCAYNENGHNNNSIVKKYLLKFAKIRNAV